MPRAARHRGTRLVWESPRTTTFGPGLCCWSWRHALMSRSCAVGRVRDRRRRHAWRVACRAGSSSVPGSVARRWIQLGEGPHRSCRSLKSVRWCSRSLIVMIHESLTSARFPHPERGRMPVTGDRRRRRSRARRTCDRRCRARAALSTVDSKRLLMPRSILLTVWSVVVAVTTTPEGRVGLDVHARSVVACGLDGETGEVFERRLTPGSPRDPGMDWWSAGARGGGRGRLASTSVAGCARRRPPCPAPEVLGHALAPPIRALSSGVPA